MSIVIRHVSGSEGQVELAGTSAVVAMFYKWTLERRGDSDSGDPSWDLRASLSYQKDAFLKADRWKKNIKVRTSIDSWLSVTLQEDSVVTVEDGMLRIDRAVVAQIPKKK